MNSNSMDEDIVSRPIEKNNEDYMETCEEEVKDIIPRLQRLSIIDDETMDLPSDSEDMSCISVDTVARSINNLEGDSIADLNEKVSPTFVSDISVNIWVNEATKVAVDNKKSLHGTVETLQKVSTNMLIDTQSQDVLQKISTDGDINIHPVYQKGEQVLYEIKKIEKVRVLEEKALDLSLKHIMNEVEPSSAVSENKSEFQSLMTAPEEMKPEGSETGSLNIILPENPDRDGISNRLVQFEDEIASGIIFEVDASKLSSSPDVFSDEQSNSSSGVMIDYLSYSDDTNGGNAASIEVKPSRKTAIYGPPVTGMNEIRQRRFGIFQPQCINIDAIEAAKTNSSSDEDFKKSCTIRKGSPRNSKRRCRKTAKSSPISRTLNPSDLKNDEEKRPSPCKRKNSSSDNLVETTGKLRKRSKSENNSEIGEKTHLVNRSRSLSPGSKINHCASNNNQITGISIIPQCKKRTNSSSLNVSHIKYRKSSSSSDDVESK